MAEQKLIDWAAPAAQPVKLKMLDALTPTCPNHPPRTIEDADDSRYVGRKARSCACVSLVCKTLRAVDSFQQRKTLCWPSVESLAKRAGCSLRTMQRGLKLARDWGYLSITPQSGKATSHYAIAWPRIWKETQEGETPQRKRKGNAEIVTNPGVTTCHPSTHILSPQRGDMLSPRIQYMNSNLNQHDGNDAKSQRPKAALEREIPKAGWHVHLERSQLTDAEYLLRTFAPRAEANGLIPVGRGGQLVLLAAARLALRGENAGGLFWNILRAPDRSWLTAELSDDALKALQRISREKAVVRY